MTDTPETLQAALADLRDRHSEAMKSLAKWTIDVDTLTARVAAFEQAQKRAEEEEPLCRNGFYLLLCDIQQGRNVGVSTKNRAMREWDRMERELARLREGLKVQDGDAPTEAIEDWAAQESATWLSNFAREIQRHRALVGGGK